MRSLRFCLHPELSVIPRASQINLHYHHLLRGALAIRGDGQARHVQTNLNIFRVLRDFLIILEQTLRDGFLLLDDLPASFHAVDSQQNPNVRAN